MTIRIHVNKNIIARNRKDGKNRPMYRIQYPNGKTLYSREVLIPGPSRFVEGPPLECGARAYLETDVDPILYDSCEFAEIEK